MAKQQGPEFVRYFPPILKVLAEMGGVGGPAEVRDRVVTELAIPQGERDQLLRSGNSRVDNRVDWARFYLAKAGLIDKSERGVWRLTAAGYEASDRVITHAAAVALYQQVQSQFSSQRATQAARSMVAEPELPPPSDQAGSDELGD